jgi:hypothetical protein
MPTALEKLIKIGSESIGPATVFSGKEGTVRAYLDLLNERNGFYAFESALLVRPGFADEGPVVDSRVWNQPLLWKVAYESLQPKGTFFAEDVFGNQFGIESEKIIRFEAETGEVEHFASSLEEWADRMLTEFSYYTGYPIAHQWQEKHGPLELGKRLVLKQPLILGGKIDLENIICWNDVKAMRARGSLAEQLKDVPEGGQIVFEYTE